MTDTAPPRQGWVYPAVIGQCVLAGSSVLALVTGLRFPARRRAAAITAWVIIPVGLGRFVLIPRLFGGSQDGSRPAIDDHVSPGGRDSPSLTECTVNVN